MKITLAETPGWPSPYGKGGALVPFPKRMRFLAPDALAALAPIADAGAVFTDVFRSPAASMVARATKAGVAKPGYSAHNFGLAVDLDVRRSIASVGAVNKLDLDNIMFARGWLCYRRDHALDASESWHYTFGTSQHGSAGVESVIRARYGAAFLLTPTQAQEALAKLRLYAGAIDGDFGRQSRAALDVFKRGWKLPADGKLDAPAQRLLAVVAAELDVIP